MSNVVMVEKTEYSMMWNEAHIDEHDGEYRSVAVLLHCYNLPHSVFFQYRNVACTAGGPSVAVQLSSPRRRPRHLSTLLTLVAVGRRWVRQGATHM